MSNVLQFIGDIFKPLTKVIDDVHTSDEEKMQLANEMQQIQNSILSQVIELEGRYLSEKSKIIQAEANGQSWLQRSWRPITMLTFLGLVVFDSFGWLANPLAQEAWTLLQIGLGGYVVGRSGEKIISQFKK